MKKNQVVYYLAGYVVIMLLSFMVLVIITHQYKSKTFEGKSSVSSSISPVVIPQALVNPAVSQEQKELISATSNLGIFNKSKEVDDNKNKWKLLLDTKQIDKIKALVIQNDPVYFISTDRRTTVIENYQGDRLLKDFENCNNLSFQKFDITRPGISSKNSPIINVQKYPLAIKQFINPNGKQQAILNFRKIGELDWIQDDWNGISQLNNKNIYLELECIKILDKIPTKYKSILNILNQINDNEFNVFYLEREFSIAPFIDSFKRYTSDRILKTEYITINYLKRGEFIFPFLQICGSNNEIDISTNIDNYKKNATYICIAVDIVNYDSKNWGKYELEINKILDANSLLLTPTVELKATPTYLVKEYNQHNKEYQDKINNYKKIVVNAIEMANFNNLNFIKTHRLGNCNEEIERYEGSSILYQCKGRPAPVYFDTILYCLPESDACSFLTHLNQLPLILKDKGLNYKYVYQHFNSENNLLKMELYFLNEQSDDGFSILFILNDEGEFADTVTYNYSKKRLIDTIRILQQQK